MRNDHASLRCCLLAVLAAAVAPLRAANDALDRQQLKPERVVSDTAALFIATPDFRKASNAFGRTAFRALLGEEEVAKPLLDSLVKLQESYVKGDGTRSEVDMNRRRDEIDLLTKLAPHLDGQVALSLDGDLSRLVTSGQLPRFLLVVGIPPGEEGDKRRRELEQILEKHRASQGASADSRYKDYDDKVGGYDVVRIENADLKLVETWAFVENLLLYGQGKRVVEDAIERFAMKNGAGTLALHSGYQEAYKQVGRSERADAQVYLQADLRALAKDLGAYYPELHKFLDVLLAADPVRPNFALGVHVGEGDKAPVKEKMLMRLKKDIQPRTVAVCDGITARFAPIDPLFYNAQQGSLADLVKLSRLGAAPEAEGAESKDGILGKLKAALGVQKEAEFLDLFKGEMALILTYTPQPSLAMDSLQDYFEAFQPVFALEIDRENAVAENALKAQLLNIQRSTGHDYVQTSTAGIGITYQKGAAPQEEASGNTPLGLFRNILAAEPPPDAKGAVPFFAAHAKVDLEDGGRQRKFLLLSDSLNALKTACRLAQLKGGKATLADDKKLADLTRGFRESRNGVLYLDLLQLATAYGDELPRLARNKVLQKELADKLPSANVLRDHVFPLASATSSISEGEEILIESSSPMGNLPMLGVGLAVAYPAISQRQQEAISQQEDERFKRLMLALHLYAASFNRFPTQLSDLYPNFIKADIGLRVFESPFRRGLIKTAQDADSSDLSNLIYIPGRSLHDLGNTVVLYEKDATKLVVISDGSSKLFHHVITVDCNLSLKGRNFLNKQTLDRSLAGKVELPGSGTSDIPTTKETKKDGKK